MGRAHSAIPGPAGRGEARSGRGKAPYELLLELIWSVRLAPNFGTPGPFQLVPESERALLAWCAEHGLLGVLPHETEVASLAPRWEPVGESNLAEIPLGIARRSFQWGYGGWQIVVESWRQTGTRAVDKALKQRGDLVPRGYLSEVELALLFRAVPHDDVLKHLRDRALLGLLGLQALRTVEVTRANVTDLQRHGDNWALLVHGKFHDRLVFLRPDVAEAVRAYLEARGTSAPDELGEALLVADGNFARGHRLSRRGVRHVVDGYLRAASIKRPQVSNHALRHTSATLAYRYTRDLRAAQDMLGHQDPKKTARYARVVESSEHRSLQTAEHGSGGYPRRGCSLQVRLAPPCTSRDTLRIGTGVVPRWGKRGRSPGWGRPRPAKVLAACGFAEQVF